MNPLVDPYFQSGCMRCPLGNTPQCKVHKWEDELARLRLILSESPLTEELKWGVPCYTYQNSNVILIGAFKKFCSLSFMKGALMKDPDGLLEKPGEDTQAARVIRLTGFQELLEKEEAIKACIREAIEVEKSGLKFEFKKITDRTIPAELEEKFEEIPALKTAFQSLTPGRQRAYLIHFTQPVQSSTRVARIEKYIPQILAGEGFNEKYRSKKS